jgi:hypothetical protein
VFDIFDKCKNIKKLVLKKCKIFYIKNITIASTLKSLNLFDSEIRKMDNLPPSIENLDLRYTFCTVVLPSCIKLKKFKTNHCNTSINPLNCMHLDFSKVINFSILEDTGSINNVLRHKFLHIEKDTFKFNTCLKKITINSYTMSTPDIALLSTGTTSKRILNKLEIVNTIIDNMENLKLYISDIKKLYMKNNINTCFDFTKYYSDSLKKIVIYNSGYVDTSFIANLGNLEKVQIRAPVDLDLTVFKSPEKIKILYIYAFNILNTKLLLKFTNLKHLYLDIHTAGNLYDTILFISSCKSIETLGFNIRGVDRLVAEYILWPFSTLPLLKKLDITRLGITDYSYLPTTIDLCSLYNRKKEYDSTPGYCNISFS